MYSKQYETEDGLKQYMSDKVMIRASHENSEHY